MAIIPYPDQHVRKFHIMWYFFK